MSKLKIGVKVEDKVVALPKIKKNKDRDDLEDIYFADSKYAIKTDTPKSPMTPTRQKKSNIAQPTKKTKEDLKLP